MMDIDNVYHTRSSMCFPSILPRRQQLLLNAYRPSQIVLSSSVGVFWLRAARSRE